MAATSNITIPTSSFYVPAYQDPQLLNPGGENMGMTLVGFTGKLLVILVMIYFTIWFIRKTMRQKRSGLLSNSHIRVLDQHYISQKQGLHLVEVSGEILLIGSTDTQLTTLHQVADPSGIFEQLDHQESPKFKSVLSGIMGKESVAEPEKEDTNT